MSAIHIREGGTGQEPCLISGEAYDFGNRDFKGFAWISDGGWILRCCLDCEMLLEFAMWHDAAMLPGICDVA